MPYQITPFEDYFQQGDIIFKPVLDVPEDAKPTRGTVIAEGEKTGHKHEVVQGDFRLYERDGVLYLGAQSGVSINHNEHHPLELPAGNYRIERVREYDYSKEAERRERPVTD